MYEVELKTVSYGRVTLVESFGWGCSGRGAPSTTKAYQSIVTSRSRSGIDLPDWRQRVRSHDNATTPFSATDHTFKYKPSDIVMERGCKLASSDLTKFINIRGHVGNIPAYNPSSYSTVSITNRAKSAFLKAALQEIRPFSEGVFLGELSKTLKTLKSPFAPLRKEISNYFGKLKKASRRKGSTNKKKALADAYLEYRFATTQIMRDVSSARKALQKVLTEGDSDVQKISRTVNEYGGTEPYDAETNISGIYVKNKYSTKIVASAYISGAVYTSSKLLPHLMTGETGRDIFPDSWAPDMWELLPYSFIVDYFTNYGDIISAASIVERRLVYASLTTRIVADAKCELVSATHLPSYPDGVFEVRRFGSLTARRKYVVRTSLGSIIPLFEFTLPKIGSIPALNMAVLLYRANLPRPFY